MKAKIGRGRGFRGVTNYALDEAKKARIVAGNMTGRAARELAAEFAISRQMRPEVERPVLHCSLSAPPGEEISPEKWNEIVTDFMARMGLGSHQHVGIQHRDTAHQHVHIIASRIGLDGSIWHGQWEARRAIEATQEIERIHGLTLTPGIESVDAEDHRRSLTKNEIERALRTEEAPPRQVLQDLITAAARPQSVLDFIDELEAAGVDVYPHVATTGHFSGFAFGYGGIVFKGSQVGKGFSWGQLQKRGVFYDQVRDGAALIERAKRARTGNDPKRNGAEGSVDRNGQKSLAGPGGNITPDGTGDPGHGGTGHGGGLGPDRERIDGVGVYYPNSQADFGGDHRAGSDVDSGQDRGGQQSDDSSPGYPSPEPGLSDGGASGDGQGDPAGLGAGQGGGRGGYDRGGAAGGGRTDAGSPDGGDFSGGGHESGAAGGGLGESGGNCGPAYRDPVDTAAVVDDDLDRGGGIDNWRRAAATVGDLAAPVAGGALASGDGGPRQPLTPAQEMKIRAWERQAAALGAPRYRIQLKARRVELNTYNLGKGRGPDGEEEFYTVDEVKSKIPFLSRENARGYDIYIAPIDPSHHYLVVDDMTSATARELVAAGYRPALIQESSQNDRQAILKVPRDGGGPAEQSLANGFVKELNRRWGDKKFSGAIHPFRLAGFSNKKPGKFDAFTRILETSGVICQKGADELAAARKRLADEIKRRSPARETIPVVRFKPVQPEADAGGGHDAEHDEKLLKMYGEASRRVLRWVYDHNLEVNWSAVDYRVAIELLGDHLPSADVARAIEVGSPGLSERHNNISNYLRLTVQAAEEDIAGRGKHTHAPAAPFPNPSR